MAGPNLRYPFKNIDKSDDYLKIDILEYVPPGLNSNFTETFKQPSSDDVGYGSKEIKGSVILPIPEGVADSNVAGWDPGNMGPLAGVTMGAAGEIITSKDFLPQLGETIADVFKAGANAAKTSTGQIALKNLFASKIAQNIVSSEGNQNLFTTALARETGAVFNENIELLFTNVSLRPAFSFQFDMVPRSKRESDEIKEIIRLFKVEMAAKKGLEKGDASGLFLKSPSVFRLEYMSGGKPHPYLNKFKICALTGMTVNYTGSGTYATYADATPVHMQMGLNFQELTPIYREDYVDNDGNFKLDGTGY
jgi:hypothetical protein